MTPKDRAPRTWKLKNGEVIWREFVDIIDKEYLVREVLPTEVSTDAGMEEAALIHATGLFEFKPEVEASVKDFIAGWQTKPTRKISELTARELMENPIVRNLVETLDDVSGYDQTGQADIALAPFQQTREG